MYLDEPKSPADFWSNDAFWPREDQRFYFIARAFNMIGMSLFPGHWTGAEGHTVTIRPLPDTPSAASEWEREVAAKAVQTRFPEFARPAWPAGGSTLAKLGDGLRSIGRPAFEAEHWEYARTVWQGHLDKRQPVIDRRRAVAEWIVTKAHDDKTLRMVVVDKRSLQPFADLPEHWNLKWDRLERRWQNCAYNPNEPNNPEADPVAWIMVFREDLDRLLRQGAPQGSLALESPDAVEVAGPQAEEVEARNAAIYATGAAGRPTSIHLILAEIEERIVAGTPAPATKTGAASELALWLSAEHSKAPALTPKSMTNRNDFSSAYRKWKASCPGE